MVCCLRSQSKREPIKNIKIILVSDRTISCRGRSSVATLLTLCVSKKTRAVVFVLVPTRFVAEKRRVLAKEKKKKKKKKKKKNERHKKLES